ncbi:Lactonase, 7-bladed beta-propeller-domain-containing protein [Dendryphion nanum]|uniref:Lactonase, 7-bladed beta-propeller-domain-containing protein n=1 Tax=Dendryphion nanum TaxID=256645 RepID=A0A9P9ELB5_9PLEO|nr:Lactonase, 7-bladed beta-propeller-domain-containing protein [Dendryphion nanum]
MVSAFNFLVPLFGGLATAQSANLWASHYSGTINYLTFSGSSLALTKETRIGNNLPSWITYDNAGQSLYIPDETWTAPTGSLVGFKIGTNGALSSSGKVTTPQGVVATTLFGGADGRSFIANAHYQTSQLTTFKLPLSGQPLQSFKYTMNGKGPNPSRQEVPHPHHVFPDPTGNFLLLPDLGADLIRIYQLTDKNSGQLKECPSAKAAAGSGPRHGVFWSPSSSRVRQAAGTFLYTADELSNTVTGWSVTYPSGGGCLTLTRKQTLSPYQNNAAAPRGTKLAEVRVKDNFLYSSNRNDKKFAPNDSITQYTIEADGSLKWTELTSSYGTYPRTFDINKAGTFVAIGDQTTANVAIVKRDPATGKLTGQVANLRIGAAGTPENEDGVSAVVWADSKSKHQSLVNPSSRLPSSLIMKSDIYLTLCLEQAASSPLRYRHGCIIVRGGKVIGQGFSDYRSGFNGGALKTGRLPSGGNQSAIVGLKMKQKLKLNHKGTNTNDGDTFKPFEGMGGGHLVNTPLSMHSEMMAIHAALNASSTSASSAVLSIKPYLKLSGDSKRKAQLRRDAVKLYVEQICKAALAHGDLKPIHLSRANLNLALPPCLDRQGEVSSSAENSTEKHRLRKNKNRPHRGNYVASSQHKQEHRQPAHRLKAQGIVAPCYSKYVANTSNTAERCLQSHPSNIAKAQPMLVPKSQTGHSSYSVSERRKHPRLNGADLYVARLGWKKATTTLDEPYCCCGTVADEETIPPDTPPDTPPRTGSLHDELTNKYPTPSTVATTASPSWDKHPPVLASRPCYRCISYMSSVGIKRVFWTTDAGIWEGAKVRDLVDALDNLGSGDGSNTAATIANIFVTKHEVLMLRRTMGDT